MSDSDLLVALVARLGGTVDLGRKELEAAKGLRVVIQLNPLSGEAVLRISEH